MIETARMPTAISPSDFQTVRGLLRRHAALVLDDGKEYLVEARLGGLAQREGLSSLAELLTLLRNPSTEMCQKVVEAMTIHETSFFRDWKAFEAMRRDVIPRLIQARSKIRQLYIWSAACSTGQEPYCLAMMLREHFPELATWKVRILATDISRAILAQARQGKFSQLEVNRGLPAHFLVKYFERRELNFVVVESVRAMVEFQHFNLAEAWPALPLMDLALLRNVVIYFDPPRQREIFERMRRVLQPDGYLVVGGGDPTADLVRSMDRAPFDGPFFQPPQTPRSGT
jgi:chemotaxis protein methyltransferase CheR